MTEFEQKLMEGVRRLGVEKSVYLITRFLNLTNDGMDPTEAVKQIREEEMI